MKEVVLEYTMKDFQKQLQENLNNMTGKLFRSSVSGNEVFDLYIVEQQNTALSL